MFFLGGSSLVLGLNLLQAASVPLRKLFFLQNTQGRTRIPTKCRHFVGILLGFIGIGRSQAKAVMSRKKTVGRTESVKSQYNPNKRP